MISVRIYMKLTKNYIFQTRSQTKTSGTYLPYEHDIAKGIDPKFKIRNTGSKV